MSEKSEKTIHDPIHGSIRIEGLALDLLDTPEVQRLRGIHQLGLAHLVFPGGNHSRFEHSLGVLHLVRKFGEIRRLEEEDLKLLSAAAILHDLGHPPFSHTLEPLMIEHLKKNHVRVGCEILMRGTEIDERESKRLNSWGVQRVAEVLEKYRIDPREVCAVIKGKHVRPYLAELMNSEVDLDQMDFLLRDAHFTGVALGMIDVDRLMRTLTIQRKRLVILNKGVEAVEGLLTARALMYTSVYFHPTVRAAELMLANAVERALHESDRLTSFNLMTDAELIEKLYEAGGYSREMIMRLKYRLLFKPAYEEKRKKLNEKEWNTWLKKFRTWHDLQELQNMIADKGGVPEGYVLLDVPITDLLLSEPRIGKVEIPVLIDGHRFRLSEVSPIASALKERATPRYLLRVLTLPKFAKRINKATRLVL